MLRPPEPAGPSPPARAARPSPPARAREDAAIAASLDFGVYERKSGTQVGHACVVTDHVTFARLRDVCVDPAARGRGLGVRLAEAARDHLAPAGARRIPLATGDARGVYAKAGFLGLEKPGRRMAPANGQRPSRKDSPATGRTVSDPAPDCQLP
ncbi:GNAT family N-acetyltransferase [Streptomyces sp. NPDC060198]|uniref:GNAT family N-acetyltransferase n=1 Tax=Streptomyces sp. NPDC060198 TaxID=3347070 RepID=UPI0036552995